MSTKTKESRKLKDLIRIGVFSALWIAVGWIIACTIGFFPPVLMVLPCILALVGSIIFVVLLSKLTIPGGILIPSFLMGLTLFTMVPYGMLFFCTFAGGIIGEILYNVMGRTKFGSTVVGVCFPMLGMALGEYIPLNFMQDAFRAHYATDTFGTAPIGEVVMNLISTPLVIVFCAVTLLLTWLGCLWGKRIVEKRLASKSAPSTKG